METSSIASGEQSIQTQAGPVQTDPTHTDPTHAFDESFGEVSVQVAGQESYRSLITKGFSELERYALLRFFYKYGAPLISDAEYDVFEKGLRAEYPDEGICKRSYDDDPIPWDLLDRSGITKDTLNKLIYGIKRGVSPKNQELFERYLAVDKSKSISAYFEWVGAMPWLYSMRGRTLNLSLKIDGCNSQSLYLPSDTDPGVYEYCCTFSRGRDVTAKPIDLTAGCSRVFPMRVKAIGAPFIIVRAEIYCALDRIDDLNAKYGNDLVTSRGIGLSMARTTGYADEDYSALKFNVFYANFGESVSSTLDLLFDQQIPTVPYYTLELPVDASESEIRDIIYEHMGCLKDYADSQSIDSDGIVIQLDDLCSASDLATDGMYDAGVIALKTDFWKPDILRSKVVRIEIQQQQERANCVAIIEPVRTSKGKTIQRVNCFNPDILISSGINIGSTIEFQYKNETTVDLIY